MTSVRDVSSTDEDESAGWAQRALAKGASWEDLEPAVKWIGIGFICLLVNQGIGNLYPWGIPVLDQLLRIVGLVTLVRGILSFASGIWLAITVIFAYVAIYWQAFATWFVAFGISGILVIYYKVLWEPQGFTALAEMFVLSIALTLVVWLPTRLLRRKA